MNASKLISSHSKTKYLTLSFALVFAAGCGKSGNGDNSGRNPFGLGPAGVSLSRDGGMESTGGLRSAGSYVILAKTGISNVTGSVVTGHMGASPVSAGSITGFALSAHATNVYSTSPQVVGKVYAAAMASPTSSNLTSAIGSMQTSYTDAAGRSDPDYLNLKSGNLGGLTLEPGLYKWTNNVTIPTTVYISGSESDVWIFQISGNVTMASGMNIILQGGAKAENIYWQVAGQVNVGSNSHFEGIILCKTAVNFLTNASLNGRIFSQTFVALDDNAITQP